MKNKRVVKDEKRYYPEYYKKPYFFGLLGDRWKRYKTEELVLNGSFTSLETCDLSFPNLEEAKSFIKESEKEVVYEK
jgi:hypothetical protein